VASWLVGKLCELAASVKRHGDVVGMAVSSDASGGNGGNSRVREERDGSAGSAAGMLNID